MASVLLEGVRNRKSAIQAALENADPEAAAFMRETLVEIEEQLVRLEAEEADKPEEPRKIIGYRRIYDGGCAHCLEASQYLYSTGDLLPIHEHCNCGVAPVFDDEDHGLQAGPPQPLPDPEIGPRLDQTTEVPEKLPPITPDPDFVRHTPGDGKVLDGPIVNNTVKEYVRAFPDLDDLDDLVAELEEIFDDVPVDVEALAGWARYSSTTYKQILKWMREGMPPSKSPLIQEFQDALPKMIQSMRPAPQEMKVLRGLRGDDIKSALGLDGELRAGAILQDRGFMSTTLDREVAERYTKGGKPVLLEIVVPKGTKINFMSGMNTEVVLAPNAKLEIIDIVDGVVKARVVP